MGPVFNDLDVVDETLRPLGSTTFGAQRVLPQRQDRMSRGHAFELLVKRSMINGCALSFRAEFRAVVCPLDGEAWLHDEWIALLVAALSKVGPIARPLGTYRQHTSQTMGATPAFQANYQHVRVGYIDVELDRINRAIDRLGPHRSRLRHQSFLRFIEGKRAHLLRRRNLPWRKALQVPIVAWEVLSGNDKRYSRWLKLELRPDLKDA